MKKLILSIMLMMASLLSFSQIVHSIHYSVGQWVDGRYRYSGEHDRGARMDITFDGKNISIDDGSSYKILSSGVHSKVDGKFSKIAYQCVDGEKNKCTFAWIKDVDGMITVEITYALEKRIRFVLMNDSKLPLED